MIRIFGYYYINGTKSTLIDHNKIIPVEEENEYKAYLLELHEKADAIYFNCEWI